MRRFAPSLFALLPFLVGVPGRSAHAEVPTYSTFELQARSNLSDGYQLPAGSSFNSGTPALNDDGIVAFRLIVVGSTGNAGLWYGSGGSGSVVYHAPAGPLLSDPSLNTAGKAAFEQADFGLSDGVFVYDPAGPLTQQEVAPGGIFGIDSFSDPIINDSDTIGFRADQGAQNAYIFETASDEQSIVAFEGGNGVGFLFTPKFDNLSRFGAKVRLGGTAGSQPDQIRRYNPSGAFDVLAEDDDGDPLSPYAGFSNGVGMSPGGLVAFVAQRVGGGDGVYVSDGITVTEIATVDDAEITSVDFFAPAVNDAGLVAFRAFDAGGRAIFVGDGTTLRRVIGEHDIVPTDLGDARIDQHDSSPVFGGTVAINAHGMIAFAATLTPPDDNQIEWGTGMFVAYPDGVTDAPEIAAAGETLLPPAPNPFTGGTRVRYAVERPGVVRLVVHDVRGRLVRTLVSGPVSEGARSVWWDGRSESGRRVPSGTYFLRLVTPDGSRTTKVVRI